MGGAGLIRSAQLSACGVVHGFGDRRQGVSVGVYASGNAGLRSGDDPSAVRTNRGLFAQALGRSFGDLCTLRQVHGTTALHVSEPEQGLRDGDALVTRTPSLLLAVTTADCMPVLLADADAGVVGAAHAGWRGAVAGILEATVAAMIDLGADPARMVAAIGPAVRQDSYEVDLACRDVVLRARPWSTSLFADGVRPDRWQFDLPGLARDILMRTGVKGIDDLYVNTVEDSARYFSYRRSRQRGDVGYGVQLSGIGLAS